MPILFELHQQYLCHALCIFWATPLLMQDKGLPNEMSVVVAIAGLYLRNAYPKSTMSSVINPEQTFSLLFFSIKNVLTIDFATPQYHLDNSQIPTHDTLNY